MKKVSEIKYPHSANLFQFCRRVLDRKFGGIRVIDQDVGQILNFDPADCSHWKKGKKNIKSIQAIKTIADHLGVDESLIVGVACGSLDDVEAYHEFCGYGDLALNQAIADKAKKEFYRKNSTSWSKEKELMFSEYININVGLIDETVAKIHEKINFQEAPLYLPEIINAYEQLELKAFEPGQSSVLPTTPSSPVSYSHSDSSNKFTITFELGSEMKPYIRYGIAKALCHHFMRDHLNEQFPSTIDNGDLSDHLIDVTSNLFAAKLLTPANLLRKEIANVDVSKNVVTQLAETFWVSKSFINRRLKQILQEPSIL